jgi:predicted transcriptional regulator of viral defense system
MEYHGLTDRIPKVLFYTSPAPPRWREFARERMKKDFGDDLPDFHESHLPKIVRINFNKINKRVVSQYASDHLGAFKSPKGKMLRVSTIGRTFLDMLRRPDLCGGINHVIDVYKEHSEKYLNLIINEIDAHGKPIDKIRAGYILEEKCTLENELINRWHAFVQRGGSRKLDPTEEYSSDYSERWCLSININ